jgi:hypothetical protein
MFCGTNEITPKLSKKPEVDDIIAKLGDLVRSGSMLANRPNFARHPAVNRHTGGATPRPGAPPYWHPIEKVVPCAAA